jgi:glycosyltransferase involved in cell wall biosynthesis
MRNKGKVVFVHPTGNANARAAAAGLLVAGLVAEFHTAIASFPGTLLDKLGVFGPLKEIRRRRFDIDLQPFTVSHPWREAGRLLSARAGWAGLIQHETGPFCIDAVYQGIDKKIAQKIRNAQNQGFRAVYAYEDGALQSFKQAKAANIKAFYDLPIGYWRTAHKLMEAEKGKWPEWAPTLTGLRNSEAKLARKDEELSLADQIFVASSYTAKTLQDYPGKLAPIQVIPYGFPEVKGGRSYQAFSHNRPLKLLFVGGLSQRKGIANLFQAVENLGKKVELTVVGRKSNNVCVALDKALSRHTWIPSLPHHAILKIMQEHDVLIFPSLFEGFGLVITEAMSQGTPVITTERTAGPDLIKHNQNGWLVEAGSTLQLQQQIEKLLQQPEEIRRAGDAAMQTATERPWSKYGEELASAISKLL